MEKRYNRNIPLNGGSNMVMYHGTKSKKSKTNKSKQGLGEL